MNKTCPLCGTVLIPRYEFVHFSSPDYIADMFLKVRYICPDCIPPDPEENKEPRYPHDRH